MPTARRTGMSGVVLGWQYSVHIRLMFVTGTHSSRPVRSRTCWKVTSGEPVRSRSRSPRKSSSRAPGFHPYSVTMFSTPENMPKRASRITVERSVSSSMRSSSAAEQPTATIAARNEPELVPATRRMWRGYRPCSSRTCSAPTYASPLVPPPSNARFSKGRVGWGPSASGSGGRSSSLVGGSAGGPTLAISMFHGWSRLPSIAASVPRARPD